MTEQLYALRHGCWSQFFCSP